MNYHLMHVDFAEPLFQKFPKAIKYVEGTFVLTGEFPKGFEGELRELDKMELNYEDLVILVDSLITSEPVGCLVIVSQTQGDWLLRNHPSFMQQTEV
jgi:hypothetical protein